MKYISISSLVVLTALLATAGTLAAAPVQSGVKQFSTGRALQGPSPQQKLVVPVAPPNPIPISTLPYDITQPGYYQLTKTLVAVAGFDGIGVFASDVIIDLNGFGLNGNGQAGKTAIRCYSTLKLMVFNGKISSWNDDGIVGVEDTTVLGVHVTSNGGVGLAFGPKAFVQDCTVTYNENGIRGSDLEVVDSEVIGNKVTGILCLEGSFLVRNCRVSQNGTLGIGTSGASPLGEGLSVIEDCLVEQNGTTGGLAGILINSAFAQVRRCFVSGSPNGINVGESSYVGQCSVFDCFKGIATAKHSKVEGCNVRSSQTGIAVGDNSSVTDCEVTDNPTLGISCNAGSLVRGCNVSGNATGVLIAGIGGSVEDCTVTDNVHGISVRANTLVANNEVARTQGTGIFALEDGNRIEGNHVAQSGVGIQVQGTRNLIVRNSLDTNAVQMQIAADNIQGPFLKTKGFIQSDNPWANFDLSFPATFP